MLNSVDPDQMASTLFAKIGAVMFSRIRVKVIRVIIQRSEIVNSKICKNFEKANKAIRVETKINIKLKTQNSDCLNVNNYFVNCIISPVTLNNPCYLI